MDESEEQWMERRVGKRAVRSPIRMGNREYVQSTLHCCSPPGGVPVEAVAVGLVLYGGEEWGRLHERCMFSIMSIDRYYTTDKYR
jgi:hypothetical protein